MPTFKSYTDIPWAYREVHRSKTTDGRIIIEHITTDERREANDLFNDWFDSEGLVWGRDYWLEQCPGHNVIVCFNNVDVLKYFEYRNKGAQA